MKKVTIYTAPSCPFCTRAKELLKRKNIPFEEIFVSWDEPHKWEEMEKRSGMKTVPQIFFGDECVGGYTDLAALDQAGKIEQILSRK